MSINIIAAMAKNRVIGLNGQIPWHISKDLKYFKKMTSGKNSAIVMGRETWDSLPIKPLPNRRNFVLTKKLRKQTKYYSSAEKKRKQISTTHVDAKGLKKHLDSKQCFSVSQIPEKADFYLTHI